MHPIMLSQIIPTCPRNESFQKTTSDLNYSYKEFLGGAVVVTQQNEQSRKGRRKFSKAEVHYQRLSNISSQVYQLSHVKLELLDNLCLFPAVLKPESFT